MTSELRIFIDLIFCLVRIIFVLGFLITSSKIVLNFLLDSLKND
jgi:hypothetical protein